MKTLRLTLALGAAIAALGVGPAMAATVIPGLFNTGVDNANVALVGGNGLIDTHYKITQSNVPGAVDQQAVTFFAAGLAAEDGNSRWVSVNAAGGPANATSSFYELVFDLTGFDHTTAQITGLWGSTGFAALYLNRNFTGKSVNGAATLGAFSLSSGFQPGVNTIAFLSTSNGFPAAFRVDELQGTAISTLPPQGVPEPQSWALMITGFLGVGGVLRSRRRLALA